MASTMKALIKAKPGAGLELTERPMPELGTFDVLVKVKASSICGTDLHIRRWDPWAQKRLEPPLVVGHECAGEVVEVGSQVADVVKGSVVALESHVTCGICDMCRTGRRHLCRRTEILGVDRDGCFAEYVVVPALNAWAMPQDVPIEIVALQENFGNAVHTAFTVDVRAKKVLVTGCGPVGLMSIAVCRAIGARAVYATDISGYRLKLARKIGADIALNVNHDDVLQKIREATEGEGVDVLLEMSGAETALREGFDLVKPGGEVALLGLPGHPVEFDFDNLLVFKGISVHGVIGRLLWETWYQARGLLRSGEVDLGPLITHQFPLERFEEAFDLMESGECGKVVLHP